MEKQLSELNAGTAREVAVREARVDDLLEQLPVGVAVIDLVRLDDWESVEREITFKKQDGSAETRTVKRSKARPVYDAFVLRSDSRLNVSPAQWVALGEVEPIDSALVSWRHELAPFMDNPVSDGSLSKPIASDPAKRLRELIWEKLEPHLDGIHTVVVIPDGELHRLPWAALPGRNEGEYLIHDYALTTASSGQQLFGFLTDAHVEADPSLLVAGGIQYDKRPVNDSVRRNPSLTASFRTSPLIRKEGAAHWKQLGGAAEEADAIVSLWEDRGDVTKLDSVQANEWTLAEALPRSRFAHLATHGFFDTRGEVYGKNLREQSLFENAFAGSQRRSSVAYRNPLLMTGIVLAGANVPPQQDQNGIPVGDDGVLTAEEIAGPRFAQYGTGDAECLRDQFGETWLSGKAFTVCQVLYTNQVFAAYWRVSGKSMTRPRVS